MSGAHETKPRDTGPHEQVPRRGRLRDVLKRRFGIGRPRTSTVALTMLFVAVLALWILVRPIPNSTGATGASDQTKPTPAPSYRGASAPAYPATVTPTPSHSPRPHHSPTPTGSPTASPHPSRSPRLGQSPSPTPTNPLQSVPVTGSPTSTAPAGGTAPAAINSPTP
ncbi:MAG TPA: hypothetical protein VF060_10415 [Trebonia sp.]